MEQKTQKFAPFEAGDNKKVLHFYVIETNSHVLNDNTVDFDWKPESWSLGRLEKLFEKSKYLLPKLVFESDVNLKFSELSDNLYSKLYVFAHAENYLILGVEVDLMSNLNGLISVQEELYYGKYFIDTIPFYLKVEEIFESLKVKVQEGFLDSIQKNYHQTVVLSKDQITKDIDTDLTQKLIYRADLPAREGMSTICYPKELNRRFETVCAVGPFVTILGKQQLYMVYSTVFSSLLITSLKQKISGIRELVFLHLKNLEKNDKISTAQMRKTIAEINKLRLRLNSEIESYHMIGAFIPAMRLEDYHFTLWNQSQLREKIVSTKELLDKSKDYIELTHISREELQKEEEKISKESWSLVFALMSVLAIPPSIIFGYLGANIKELRPITSILNTEKFGFVYISVFAITVFILALGYLLSFYRKRKFRSRSFD